MIMIMIIIISNLTLREATQDDLVAWNASSDLGLDMFEY